MPDQILRWQCRSVENICKSSRIVLVNGARQSGKTTLVRDQLTLNTEYRSLDDPRFLKIAEIDPFGFVKHQHDTLIIDEIQRAPSLLPVIKLVVDQDNRPGQFLLTGSANVHSIPTVQESLAGRVRRVRLRPLSQGEIYHSKPSFLNRAFAQDFGHEFEQHDLDELVNIAIRGGFAEAMSLNERDRSDWYNNYITTLLERDLADISNIRRKKAMFELVKTAAAWSSKFMDISKLSSTFSVSRATIESYLDILEAMFLMDQVLSWRKTDYARVGKRPKLFLSDSGLMSHILNWNFDLVRFDADRLGKLIETFAFNEIATLVDVGDDEYRYEMFQYRDRAQREVDFIVQRNDGALLAIEVKAGSVFGKSDFKHLTYFRDNLAGDRQFTGVVLYSGDILSSFGKNLFVVPFGYLWAS